MYPVSVDPQNVQPIFKQQLSNEPTSIVNLNANNSTAMSWVS